MAKTVFSQSAAVVWLLVPLVTNSPAVTQGNPVQTAQKPAHLRAEAADGQGLIDDAFGRSPTFRELASRLEGSAVVLYVRFASCRGGTGACLEYVGTTAGVTYVRATLNRSNYSPAVRAGLLAHELFHALEIGDARVTSLAEFRRFLVRHGRESTAGYETDGARAVGRRVEDELIERKIIRH